MVRARAKGVPPACTTSFFHSTSVSWIWNLLHFEYCQALWIQIFKRHSSWPQCHGLCGLNWSPSLGETHISSAIMAWLMGRTRHSTGPAQRTDQWKSLNNLRGLTVGLSGVGTTPTPTWEAMWRREGVGDPAQESLLGSRSVHCSKIPVAGRGWKVTFGLGVSWI